MMSSTVPYSVPQEPGRWQSIALAVIVHAVLLAFLWIGINWANNKPETIEAEVWSEHELEKAPPPPVQAPEPPPVEKVAPPEVKQAPVVVNPEIAIEQEKKKKRLEKEKKEQEEKLIAEKEKAEKKLVEDKKKADDKKKLDDDKKKLEIAAKKMHDEDVKRMKNEADKSDSNGPANRSQGNQNNSAWVSRVTAKVKSNIVGVSIPPTDANDPVEFVVGLLPDGSVAGIRKTKSSGIPAFDDAVRRAIEASQPYPADSSGRVPSSFISTNKPKDQ